MTPLSCKEAKYIPIAEYLAKQGIRPVYIKGNDYWYCSPLRDEKHPSFKVNTKLNAWYDHGAGEGGSIIDLGIRLHNCSVSQLLHKLSSEIPVFLFTSLIQIPKRRRNLRSLSGRSHPINSFGLISYLHEREISLQTAKQYCKQVSYDIAGKNYYAIGFQNRSGGYELRNPWFKGSSSPKDITFLDSGSKSVCVLEGFMDFLSLLELKAHRQPNANFLILNSLSLLHRSIDLLKDHQQVFFFLNNDPAGKSAALKLKESGIEGIDPGGFYKQFKDINDYLKANPISKSRGLRM